MIVGTAGHIDHGKSTLVAALTGMDADRLPEEEKRGISIEFGYAWLEAPGRGGRRSGFVDMPVHRRVVHTMLARIEERLAAERQACGAKTAAPEARHKKTSKSIGSNGAKPPAGEVRESDRISLTPSDRATAPHQPGAPALPGARRARVRRRQAAVGFHEGALPWDVQECGAYTHDLRHGQPVPAARVADAGTAKMRSTGLKTA